MLNIGDFNANGCKVMFKDYVEGCYKIEGLGGIIYFDKGYSDGNGWS